MARGQRGQRGWTVLLGAAACLVLLLGGCSRAPKETIEPPPPGLPPPLVNPWKEAALKVEEERGEPMGRQAKVATPSELEHYDDRRRFLSVQVAEWREHKFDLPQDFADLVQLIERNELVELPLLGEDYILYGAGWSASNEPFTHYDKATGESIPLYPSDAEFRQESARLAELLAPLRPKLAELDKQLRQTKRRDRARRKALLAEKAEIQKSAAALGRRKKLLDSFYEDPARHEQLTSEYATLARLAANFGGQSYDLTDPASRRKFKIRLLSFIRPEARAMIEEIARSYKGKFGRPLPITSVIRTAEYQHDLSETNPNATRNAVPPHTTGLAFDVFYGFMTAEEQNFLMAEIARLEAAGRLEALRERRDHIHVFAFADGRPPDESLVKQSMAGAGPRDRSAWAPKNASSKRGARAKPARASKAGRGKRPAKSRRGR